MDLQYTLHKESLSTTYVSQTKNFTYLPNYVSQRQSMDLLTHTSWIKNLRTYKPTFHAKKAYGFTIIHFTNKKSIDLSIYINKKKTTNPHTTKKFSIYTFIHTKSFFFTITFLQPKV